jgi:hypothetical protein
MCTEWQHTNAGAPRARLQFEGELSPKHYQYIEEAGPLKPKLSQNLVKPFVTIMTSLKGMHLVWVIKLFM